MKEMYYLCDLFLNLELTKMFLHLCLLCVHLFCLCGVGPVSQCAHPGHRTMCKTLLSLSTMWVLGIEFRLEIKFRLSGLTVTTFAHEAILTALKLT